jgi:hypothetical protein
LQKSDKHFKIFVRLTGLEFFHYSIELSALGISALISIISVTWLIQAGFEPSYTVPQSEFIGFLFFAFGTVPVYYLLSRLLLHIAKMKWEKITQESLSNKTRKEDAGI